jgi:hypothetical protein
MLVLGGIAEISEDCVVAVGQQPRRVLVFLEESCGIGDGAGRTRRLE